MTDLLVFQQTVDKLKIELEKKNISIIAVEGFEKRGDLSFQMDKLKVNIYGLQYKRWCQGRLNDQTPSISKTSTEALLIRIITLTIFLTQRYSSVIPVSHI